MFVKLTVLTDEGLVPRYFLIGTTDRSVIELGSLCTLAQMTESDEDDEASQGEVSGRQRLEGTIPRTPVGKYGLEVLWNDYYVVCERLPKPRCKYSVSVRNEPRAEIYLIGGSSTTGSTLKTVDVLRVPENN